LQGAENKDFFVDMGVEGPQPMSGASSMVKNGILVIHKPHNTGAVLTLLLHTPVFFGRSSTKFALRPAKQKELELLVTGCDFTFTDEGTPTDGTIKGLALSEQDNLLAQLFNFSCPVGQLFDQDTDTALTQLDLDSFEKILI